MPAEQQTLLSDFSGALCLCFILLAPLAVAGLSLINTGLSRSRSASHNMVLSLCAVATAAIAFFACGAAIEGMSTGPAHTFTAAGETWNWIGADRLFLRGVNFAEWRQPLVLLWQFVAVGLAAIIPASTAAERWRLSAGCLSTALLAGFTYPLFAHWVWGGGWLAQLGVNYGLGSGFLDPGGAACIHCVGGLTALSIAWIVGPRHGKFTAGGMPAAMPGHNAVLVVFGCALALIGFFGLNSAGSVLSAGIAPAQVVLIDLNTLLCAAGAALAALWTTRARFGKPDASLIANGWVTGLVASSAVCAFVKPAAAVLIGFIAGALVIFAVETIELRMKIDDPAGAIAVHGIGGFWGILAAGIFGQAFGAAARNTSGQFLAQLIGIATLAGFVLPLSYAINWLLNRIVPQRVAPEGERQGMDLFELGAGAYPEFVTHREDFTRR